MKESQKKPRKGFSLIESLISLSLFLFIVLTSLEFFGSARNLFLKLKKQEETKLAALTALDKMKTDLLSAGSGVLDPIRLGLLEGITENEGVLSIISREKELSFPSELVSGQTRILVGGTKGIRKGRTLCFFDSNKGEVKSISSVYPDSLILSSPLNFNYPKEKTSLILLKKVSLYLERDKRILRRKVNSSPAQPLLEDVTFFDFDYEEMSHFLRLRFRLNAKEEKEYEISVFPKNICLSASL